MILGLYTLELMRSCQPDNGPCQTEHGPEVLRKRLVSWGHAPELLEAKEALDEVATLIAVTIIDTRSQTITARRNHRLCP